MSSMNIESSTLPQLLSMRSEIDAAISAACGGESAVVASSAKPKKPSARTGKPTAYGAFSSKIQKENTEEIKAFKEANPDMKGAHMTWVGKYKDEHPEIYEAFKAEWVAANPKTKTPTSEPGSADEGAEPKAEKPKKILSPEHLAKMKAGREAKKSIKDAEKGVAGTEISSEQAASGGGGGGGHVTPEKPKKVLSAEHLAKLKAGREAKKLAKDAERAIAEAAAKSDSPIALSPTASAEAKAAKKPKEAKKTAAAPEVAAPVAEVAAPVAEVAAPAAEQEAEALPFKLGGATYIRMGISKADGNHEWLSGDLWLSKKGGRGSYAGELMEDGSINADAEEPEVN